MVSELPANNKIGVRAINGSHGISIDINCILPTEIKQKHIHKITSVQNINQVRN